MIIFLYGPDTYRSRQKLNEIIEKYKAKHKTGFNLKRINFKEVGLDDLKKTIETQSMFAEKKLIIVEEVFGPKSDLQNELLEYLQKTDLLKNQEVVIVFYEPGEVPHQTGKNRAEKKNALFSFLTGKNVLTQKFQALGGRQLENWIKKEVARRGGRIEERATRKLTDYLEGDLWQIANEIDKLIAFKKGNEIQQEDIDLFVKPKITTNIFNTIDALARRDKKSALRLLHHHIEEGANEIYLLTMFAYQFRNLLLVKDLTERGCNYFEIGKKTKLHPFVVKKSLQQTKNFSLETLKKIYNRLFELDLAIKTGKMEPRAALEMLVMEI